MSTLRLRWLAVVGVVAGVVGWLVNWLATRNGYGTPTLPLTSLVTTAVIIASVINKRSMVQRERAEQLARAG